MRTTTIGMLAGALLVAGCGGRAATPTAAPARAAAPLGNTAAAADDALDLAAAARTWRALAPTGADWQERLATVDDAELRRAMAIVLLQQGELACHEAVEEWGCGESWLELAPLSPTATLDDPCLRRVLALWSLAQLAPEDVREVEGVLVDLVSMPEPERELQDAAFAAAGDDALRLRMLLAAPAPLAERLASGLETPEAALRALLDLELDAAASVIDWTGREEALLAAVGHPGLDRHTRLALLEETDRLTGDAVRATLVEVAEETDCAVAMAARDRLARRGEPGWLPARPRSTDPEDHARALCLLAHDPDPARRDERWRAWIGDAGIAWSYDDPWDDVDVDADADAEPTIPRDDATFDVGPYGAAWSCTGLVCAAHDDGGSVEIELEPAGPTLRAVRVTNTSYGGCGC